MPLQEGTIDIRPVRKSGQKVEYRYELTATVGGQKFDVTGFRTETFQSVAADSTYSKEVNQFGEKATLDGSELRIPVSRPYTIKFDDMNRPLPAEMDREIERRERITALALPSKKLAIGDYWVTELDGASGRPPVRIAYSLKSVDKMGYRIEFMSAEKINNGMQAKGVIIVDEKTKFPMASEINVSGATILGVPASYVIKTLNITAAPK